MTSAFLSIGIVRLTEGEQQSEFYRQSYLRKSVVTFEFDHVGNWIKETVQRWSDEIGFVALTETVVNRERMITYY